MASSSIDEKKTMHPRARVAIEVLIVAIALAFGIFVVIDSPFWVEAHGNQFRCVKDPHELSMGNFFRWCAGFSALFLIVVLRPIAGRLAARFGISTGAVLRISLALVLALVVSEVIMRKPWAAPPPPITCDVCAPGEANARYGWLLIASSDHVWKGPGEPVTYFINAEHNRSAAVDSKPDHDRPTLLIGGESVALGIAVNYEDTFSGMLEKDLGIQVVNSAAFGYAMDQAYLREEDTIAEYTHPVALITTFVPDEVERFETEWRNSLEVAPDGGVQVRPPLAPWIREMQLRHVWRGLYHGDDEIQNMRAVARATIALAKKHGAYPLFVTTNFNAPCLDVKGQSPSLYRTLFDDQQINRIHVDVPMALHAYGDPHPGPAGHRMIADAIEKALRDAHVL
ncbi:MAG: hypothetical protein ABI183_05290 [Polyangiaceae bacterium]